MVRLSCLESVASPHFGLVSKKGSGDVLGQQADGRSAGENAQIGPGIWGAPREINPPALFRPMIASAGTGWLRRATALTQDQLPVAEHGRQIGRNPRRRDRRLGRHGRGRGNRRCRCRRQYCVVIRGK